MVKRNHQWYKADVLLTHRATWNSSTWQQVKLWFLQLFLSSFSSCLRNDHTSSCLTSRREIYSTAPLEHNHGSWVCLPRFQLFIDVFNSFSAVYEAPRGLSVNSAVSSALCFRLAACELCQGPLVWQMENLRLRFTVSVCLRNEISRQGNFTQTGYFWNKQSN